MLKNKLIQAACKLLPIRIRPSEVRQRILVVTSTALGDTLWATPAIESLRHSFPDAFIAALTSPIGMQVLKGNPWIDRLYLLKEPVLPKVFSLYKQLNEALFDTVLMFHASQRLALPLCAHLGASAVVGTTHLNKGFDAYLTHPIPLQEEHEIVRRLKMVEAIGGKRVTEKLSFFFTSEERRAFLPEGSWIALHPGSKDGFKRWPLAHFAAVGNGLTKQGFSILITGTEEERPLMEDLSRLIPGAHLMEPNLSLRQFAAVLSEVKCLVSNDTGPVHLACALNRPVVAIYSATDPKLCGPHLAERATALYKRRSCNPCLRRSCQRPFCLLQIGPDEVIDAVVKLLSQ